MSPVRIGIVGCGNISPAYLKTAAALDVLEVVACADKDNAAALSRADAFGVKLMSVDALLASSEVEVVLNLTVPSAHADVSLAALRADKHVYSEKPLAITCESAERILKTARSGGLLVGCAPDTFLGPGLQACREIIDAGTIGTPVAATGMMMSRGPEDWHPNPAFFYQSGGGPLLDVGPYYITALVTILGPVRRVSAITGRAFGERVAAAQPAPNNRFPVEIQTHEAGTLAFASGAVATVVMSFDVLYHRHHPLEIYGTEGTLLAPDPNLFGGPVMYRRNGEDDWTECTLPEGSDRDRRGLGLADMAVAIRTGGSHRCSGTLAYHVLEVMEAFGKSCVRGEHVAIGSTCERPEPFGAGEVRTQWG